MGKGSSPRPFSVSKDEYDNRFETIFGKKKHVEQPTVDEDQAADAQPDQTDDPKSQDDQ